jgi:hypothetical protein
VAEPTRRAAARNLQQTARNATSERRSALLGVVADVRRNLGGQEGRGDGVRQQAETGSQVGRLVQTRAAAGARRVAARRAAHEQRHHACTYYICLQRVYEHLTHSGWTWT